jgi:cytidylate kinase
MGQGESTNETTGDWPADWFDGSNTASPAQLSKLAEIAAFSPADASFLDVTAPRAELTDTLWDFDAAYRALSAAHAARAAGIGALVYKLVPKHCTESAFWRAYWCRAHDALCHTGLACTPGLSRALLLAQDDTTTNAIIRAFERHAPFVDFSHREMLAILERDAEDDDKLKAGIQLAIRKGVLDASPPVEPVVRIDVLGKSAGDVAGLIVGALGEAAATGCVVVLQGLSGTGKGTTVERVKATLSNSVTWSNGNVFRALTLLAVRRCEKLGLVVGAGGRYDMAAVLTAEALAEFTAELDFGWHGDAWDIRIGGGLDVLVSQVANTLLKEAVIGRHLPTVAEQTQGEVVAFASAAAAKMGAGGKVVLMEGRAPTLEYVRTLHRFELTMSEPAIIGMRRAAQRMMASAVNMLKLLPDAEEPIVVAALVKALAECQE